MMMMTTSLIGIVVIIYSSISPLSKEVQAEGLPAIAGR
jgi:uncharacterized membrane protein YjdF